jgi:hypothetical protein
VANVYPINPNAGKPNNSGPPVTVMIMEEPIILKKSVEFNPAENIQHKFDKPIGGMS